MDPVCKITEVSGLSLFIIYYLIHVYTILYHFGIFTMMTDKLIRSDKPQAVGEDFATQYQAKCIDMY